MRWHGWAEARGRAPPRPTPLNLRPATGCGERRTHRRCPAGLAPPRSSAANRLPVVELLRGLPCRGWPELGISAGREAGGADAGLASPAAVFEKEEPALALWRNDVMERIAGRVSKEHGGSMGRMVSPRPSPEARFGRTACVPPEAPLGPAVPTRHPARWPPYRRHRRLGSDTSDPRRSRCAQWLVPGHQAFSCAFFVGKTAALPRRGERSARLAGTDAGPAATQDLAGAAFRRLIRLRVSAIPNDTVVLVRAILPGPGKQGRGGHKIKKQDQEAGCAAAPREQPRTQGVPA